jgi:membrane-bound lytic murein transglycosylase B
VKPALWPLAALLLSGSLGAQGLDLKRPEISAFIKRLETEHGFSPAAVAELLRDVKTQKSTLEAIARPAERTLKWWEYRDRFMSEERITQGLALWDAQAPLLERIARERGVPAEYLLAITGVETFYGRRMGRYRVLDSLATLAFDYPPRRDFFRRELEHFLLVARDEKLDARTPVGSYAGAMGAPQFMPSSLRAYAVDGNNDGKRDLWLDWADVFASIANYFVVHGWRPGEPVLLEAQIETQVDDVNKTGVALNTTLGHLRARGYKLETPLLDTERAVLIPAPEENSLRWRVGLQNFYVITRYNRSALYAMTVHELAQALAARRRASITPAPAP